MSSDPPPAAAAPPAAALPPAAAAAVAALPVAAADPRPYIPGKEAFLKCQNGTGNEEIELMAVKLLLAVSESQLYSHAKGTRKVGDQWKELMTTLFEGNLTNGVRDGNGLFRGYKVWSVKNPHLAKLKVLVKDIVDHFSSPDAQNESTLVVVANNLQHAKTDAQRKKDETANMKAAQKIQNESAETEFGFRTPGHGVAGPSLQRPTQASDVAALAALAQPTGSVNQSGAVAASAAAAAASIVTVEGAAASSRSNSVEQALAYMSAGKSSTVTKTGSLEFIKNARGNLDKTTLTDGLESSLEKTSSGVVMNTMKLLQGSPNTKRQKTAKSIQERINLTLAEIRDLKAMGPEFADSLEDAMAQLRHLQQERKKLKNEEASSSITKNLDNDLAKVDQSGK